VRPDQANDPVRSHFPRIQDRHDNIGPIAGIIAAQDEHPSVAWLVLACDLPFLDEGTLKHLIWARQPEKLATAYRSSHDGLPEPLCAIYEPASRAMILEYLTTGKVCPRKFLIQADAALIDEPNPQALDNVNTPEEFGSAIQRFNGADPSHEKRIKVQYFAILREQAGRSEETLSTRAQTPRDVYEELRLRYPFSLAPEMLRVAVNSEFSDWSRPLAEGDAVVFIPPVAGG
jgi:molybdopterin-guanine dinucleotide biosynthesis protein A